MGPLYFMWPELLRSGRQGLGRQDLPALPLLKTMMLARISRPAGALARKVPARSLTQVSSEARRYSFAHAADDIMGKRNPPADPADRMSAGAPEASPGGLSARLPPPPGSPSPPSFRLPQPSAVAARACAWRVAGSSLRLGAQH